MKKVYTLNPNKVNNPDLKIKSFPSKDTGKDSKPFQISSCGMNATGGMSDAEGTIHKKSNRRYYRDERGAILHSDKRGDTKKCSITLLDYSRIKGENAKSEDSLFYNKKLIKFVDIIEEYNYEKLQVKVRHSSGGIRDSKEKNTMTDDERKSYISDSLLKSSYRARKEVRYTVNANTDWFGKNSLKFLTLTFKADIYSLNYANELFHKFIKRLSYSVGLPVRYIAVPQFQDKTRNGVVHYHIILFNLPFIKVSVISEIWGHGFVKINRVSNVSNVGAYMTGYMGKNFVDERFYNQKRYFKSKGLKEPEIIKTLDSPGDIPIGFQEVFSSEYDNEYAGKIKYRQFKRVGENEK